MEIFKENKDIKWYTLQVYMGSELSIEQKIYNLAEKDGYRDQIKGVLCPYEEVISIGEKTGKETILNKAIYPSYVFVAIENMDTKVWSGIQGLPKVSKFVGEKNKPVVMEDWEIEKILDKENKKDKTTPKYRVNYRQGDKVRVIKGSFENFEGYVEKFNPTEQEIEVNIKVLGRDTPTKFHVTDVTISED